MLSQLEEFKDTLFKYFETRIGLIKVETRGKVETAVVRAVYAILVLSFVLLILGMLLNILAIFLNNWLNRQYLGFEIIIAVLLLKLALILIFRKSVIRLIHKTIVNIVKEN